jgi:hypothetical protein
VLNVCIAPLLYVVKLSVLVNEAFLKGVELFGTETVVLYTIVWFADLLSRDGLLVHVGH